MQPAGQVLIQGVPSVFQLSISSLTSLTIRRGLPTTTLRSGICMSAGTNVSAPMIDPAPTRRAVHHDRVHPDQDIPPDMRAMNDRAMPDMRAAFEPHRHARERVNDARLLDVAAILDHDAAPIAADRRARADVDVAPNHDVTDNGRAGMHEGRLVDDGARALEFVERGYVSAQIRSMIVAIPCPTPTHIVASA